MFVQPNDFERKADSALRPIETESSDLEANDFPVAPQRRNDAQTVLASFSLRCSAFLLDYILTLFIPVVMLMLATYAKRRWQAPTFADALVIIGYLAAATVILFNWGYSYVQYGQSFGKRFIGLRVVRTDGQRLDYQTAALRHLAGYPLSLLGFGLGFLWPLWDAHCQGWHDKLAKTLVIKE